MFENFETLSNVFLIVQNTHIHATISPALWINFHNAILEGELYEIVNVRVHEAYGFLRPVSTPKCISFVPSTLINPYPHDDFIIPFYKFELKDFGDLYDIVHSYELANQKPIYSTGDYIFTSNIT